MPFSLLLIGLILKNYRVNVISSVQKIFVSQNICTTFTRGLSYFWGVSCGLQQRPVVFYSVLWCFVVFCGVHYRSKLFLGVSCGLFNSVLRCSAVFCGVLWCFAVFCGVLRCSAVFRHTRKSWYRSQPRTYYHPVCSCVQSCF